MPCGQAAFFLMLRRGAGGLPLQLSDEVVPFQVTVGAVGAAFSGRVASSVQA